MEKKEIINFAKEVVQEYSEDRVPRLSAALSYYTVFSLAPLVVLVLAIAGLLWANNEELRLQLVQQIESLVGPQAGEQVNIIIDQFATPGGSIIATILGVITLILGATGVFGQLQESLNTIWEVRPKEGRGIWGMIKTRFLSFTLVLGISFLLLVSLVVSAALSFVNNFFSDLLGGFGFVAHILNFVVSIGLITLVFAMIFRFLPDVEIEWRDVWVGSLITAVLFTIGKTLIGIYLGNSAVASAYGAAGSLVIILLWVYYSSQILFVGAEITQVYARRYGSKILPSENARRVTETERAHEGLSRRVEPVSKVQDGMIPVVGQPTLYASDVDLETPRERIRYEPKQPERVVPVIALGALAYLMTLGRIVRSITQRRQSVDYYRRTTYNSKNRNRL
jgi:membrane protein